jgi:hypothetical protein
MAQYKIRSKSSGKTITFNWNKETPPTQADMARALSMAEPTAPNAPQTSQMPSPKPPTQDPSLLQQGKDIYGNIKGIGQGIWGKMTEKSAPGSPSPLEAAYSGVAKEIQTPPLQRVAQLGVTPEGMGVGQGVIQGATLGYGMPVLRGLIPGSEEVPKPTGKEMAVGMGLSTAIPSPIGALKIFPKIASGKKLDIVAKSALAGYAFNPYQEKIASPADLNRGIGAAVGAGGAAILTPIVRTFQAFKNVKNSAKFAEKVREEVFNARKSQGNMFDSKIQSVSNSKPNTVVNAREVHDELNRAMTERVEGTKDFVNPGLRADIQRVIRGTKSKTDSNLIRRFVEDPVFAENMTLQESQQLKKAINSVMSAKLRQGKFANYTPGETELIEVSNNIRGSQLGAFPELSKEFQIYAQQSKAFRAIKPKLKVGVLEGNMAKGFKSGVVGQEIKQRVDSFLTPSMIRQMGGYEKAVGFLDLMHKMKDSGLLIGGLTLGAGALIGAGISRKIRP